MLEPSPNSSYGAQTSYSLRGDDMAPVITVGQWLIMFILLAIPIVNIVILILWASDSQSNPNRSNYAKATLIIMAASILLAAVFFGALVGLMQSFAYML